MTHLEDELLHGQGSRVAKAAHEARHRGVARLGLGHVHEDLEAALLMSDAGVAATETLISELRRKAKETRAETPAQLKDLLVDGLSTLLAPLQKPLTLGAQTPTVIMVAGVNGAGKTTSIGKLTHRLADEGATVLLAAAALLPVPTLDPLSTLDAPPPLEGMPVELPVATPEEASVPEDPPPIPEEEPPPSHASPRPLLLPSSWPGLAVVRQLSVSSGTPSLSLSRSVTSGASVPSLFTGKDCRSVSPASTASSIPSPSESVSR